MDVRRLITIKV